MVVSCVTIGSPTLQLLVDALNKLQSLDGLAHDDAIWSFANINMELTNLTRETCRLLRPALLNAIDLLKQLEAVGYALKELTMSCERKLKALKTTLQPSFFHCGIQTLPNNILTRIFDTVMEGSYSTSEMIVRLSHVSSRFRSLTLARPQLWSRVSLDMPPNMVKACLERSKDSLLTVTVASSFPRYKGFTELLGLAVRHSSRWKAFGFSCFSCKWGAGSDRGLQLAQSMGNCDVSHLEVLELNCCSRDNCVCRVMDVFQTLEMPKLRALHTYFIALRPLPSINISYLVISIPYEWDIRSLANVLAPLVGLVTLKLYTFQSPTPRVSNPSIQDMDITLPKLKGLRFDKIDLVSFSAWTRCFRTPRLEAFGLCVGKEPVEEWLTAIPSGSFGSVKILRFECDKYNDAHLHGDAAVDFWHLVGKFPGLEHLDLWAQSCTFDSDLRHELSMNMPPLLSLSMELASPVAGLSYFVRTLKRGGRWEQFKSFEIEMRCIGWDTKEETEEIMKGKEVKWRMNDFA